MGDLIDTTEMYLRTILELEEEQVVPKRARISERLGHSGPTVSETVSRMERDGLVRVNEARNLELTQLGRDTAIRVMRKHRLAEILLADVIGLDFELVHEEACRWEHVMSDQVEQKILSMLSHSKYSPYGNPVPGLDALGEAPAEAFRDGVISVVELISGDRPPINATLRRLAEPLQNDADFLRGLREAKVLPGTRCEFVWRGNVVVVKPVGASASVEFSMDVAAHVYVSR